MFNPIQQTKFHMKSSGDGGGVCHTSKIKRPSHAELLHRANLVLYVDYRDGVTIHKNRWGPHGKVSTKELIEILTRVLVEQVFDGRMKLFQGAMQSRLKGAIKKIVKEGA